MNMLIFKIIVAGLVLCLYYLPIAFLAVEARHKAISLAVIQSLLLSLAIALYLDGSEIISKGSYAVVMQTLEAVKK